MITLISPVQLTQNECCIQISCTSSSPALSNRDQYKTYFQMLASETFFAYGYLGITQHFGWKRVAIIVEDATVFTEVKMGCVCVCCTSIFLWVAVGISSVAERLVWLVRF